MVFWQLQYSKNKRTPVIAYLAGCALYFLSMTLFTCIYELNLSDRVGFILCWDKANQTRNFEMNFPVYYHVKFTNFKQILQILSHAFGFLVHTRFLSEFGIGHKKISVIISTFSAQRAFFTVVCKITAEFKFDTLHKPSVVLVYLAVNVTINHRARFAVPWPSTMIGNPLTTRLQEKMHTRRNPETIQIIPCARCSRSQMSDESWWWWSFLAKQKKAHDFAKLMPVRPHLYMQTTVSSWQRS